MARSTRLSDVQIILLTTAAQRPDGSLLPPPETLGDQSARIRRAVPPLIRQALVEERAVIDAGHLWREEDDRKIGLFVTDAGRAIVSVEETVGGNVPADKTVPHAIVIEAAPPAAPAPSAPTSKIGTVLDLLHRDGGATLPEMIAATGWLPHTTRAALTGLRKKGHDIHKTSRDAITVYRIVVAG